MDTGVSLNLATAFKAGFIQHCLEAIRLGYEQMLTDKEYQLHWEEDTLTNCLVTAMRKTGYPRDNGISLNLQVPIVTPAIATGQASFITAPKVDFKLSTWGSPTRDELEYFAEAKNLSQQDWHKPSGAWVRATYYRGRYLDTGIENYLSYRYPEGCLVGYVVNGSTIAVVNSLNHLIQTRSLPPRVGLLIQDASAIWTAHYHSDNCLSNGVMPLTHLLLQLA